MWPIELHLENYTTGEVRIVTLDPVTDDMMLRIAQVMAMFTLDGIRYHSTSQPVADLDRRVLVYRCAGAS